MSKYIPLILLVVTTNALSQLMLKQGMNKVGGMRLGGSDLMQALPAVALNPWVVAGLSTLVLSTCLHLMVLSRVELSYAYPFLSIAYVLVLFSSYLLHRIGAHQGR